MKQANPISFGLMIILVGVLLLAGNLFGWPVGKLIVPLLFIGVGIWLLLPRHHMGVESNTTGFIQEIKRDGRWTVQNESFHTFISDIKLDLTEADIPAGETTFYISGFIGDIGIRVPDDMGVKLSASVFISDIDVLGQKRGGIFSPIELQTADYKLAERRLHIVASHFINDIKVSVGQAKHTTNHKVEVSY